MKQLILTCSLSSASRSAVMADHLQRSLELRGETVQRVDLRHWQLPMCDGDSVYQDQQVQRLVEAIKQADAVTMATPIYNYDVGGATRNLIAVTGGGWDEKVVGLLAAAGGQRSYMALMSLANSLMLDFRCIIVPRFVYASRHCFDGDRLNDPAVEQRLGQLATDLQRFSKALAPLRSN